MYYWDIVLNAANLTGEMEKLARATMMNLTYKDMREQIKKICGTTSCDDEPEPAPAVKDEVLFGYGGGRPSRGFSYRGKGGRNRGGFQQGSRTNHRSSQDN